MKKLVKIIATCSMLVGIASCGKTEASWDAKTLNWLKENGITLDKLPTSAFEGIAAKYEEKKPTATNPQASVKVTFETNTASEVYEKFISDVLNSGTWGMYEYDEENYDYGLAKYDFLSEFKGDKTVYLGSTLVKEDSTYATAYDMSGVILEFYVNELTAADDVQNYIEAAAASVGVEDSMYAEGLSNVSDYFYLDYSTDDYLEREAEGFADTVDGEYQYGEEEGIGYHLVYVFDQSLSPEQIANKMGAAVEAFGYTVDEPIAYDEKEGAYFGVYLNGTSLEESNIVCEVCGYNYQGTIGAFACFYSLTGEEIPYISNVRAYAPDLDEEVYLEDLYLEILDDSKFEIDRYFEDTYGLLVRSTFINNMGNQFWSLSSSYAGMFRINVFENEAMVDWPADKVSALTEGFTTTVPSLDRKVMVPSLGDDLYILSLDAADHDDKNSLEQILLAKFKAQKVGGNAAWVIEKSYIAMDEEYTEIADCYIATSVEEYNKKFIQAIIFTYQYNFYFILSTVDAPQLWDAAKVASLAEGFTTVIPASDTENKIWYTAADKANELDVYAKTENSKELYDAYLAKFSKQEWKLVTQTDTYEGYPVTQTTATSIEKVNDVESGFEYEIVVTFTLIEGLAFEINMKRVGHTEIPVARINQLIAEQGWTDVALDPADFEDLGKVFTAYSETYDAENDVWVINLQSEEMKAFNTFRSAIIYDEKTGKGIFEHGSQKYSDYQAYYLYDFIYAFVDSTGQYLDLTGLNMEVIYDPYGIRYSYMGNIDNDSTVNIIITIPQKAAE